MMGETFVPRHHRPSSSSRANLEQSEDLYENRTASCSKKERGRGHKFLYLRDSMFSLSWHLVAFLGNSKTCSCCCFLNRQYVHASGDAIWCSRNWTQKWRKCRNKIQEQKSQQSSQIHSSQFKRRSSFFSFISQLLHIWDTNLIMTGGWRCSMDEGVKPPEETRAKKGNQTDNIRYLTIPTQKSRTSSESKLRYMCVCEERNMIEDERRCANATNYWQ